jgi:hypothetical protein
MSHAGGVALIETVRASGRDVVLSEALGGWRKPLAVHDPAKLLTDLVVSLALGDCLAGIAVRRASMAPGRRPVRGSGNSRASAPPTPERPPRRRW